MVLIAFAAIVLIRSFVVHSFRGATGTDTPAMVFDDVKLVATCPTRLGNVANFLLRPESAPIAPLLTEEASSKYWGAICHGDLTIALGIIKDSGSASQAQGKRERDQGSTV